MKIAQLTENLIPADAISDNVLAMASAFRDLGYETRVFAENRQRATDAAVGDVAELPAYLAEGDLLLYQYSIGSPLTDFFLRQRCRRAILYQNITPARFFVPYAPALADSARQGRERLREVLGQVELAIASSEYSARELRALGCARTEVLPLLIDFSRYEESADGALRERLRDGKKNILFVGRKAPNKRIEDLILTVDYYEAAFHRPCRLILLGDDSLEAYTRRLRDLAGRMRTEILWLGRRSMAEMIACYQAADLFLCLSEHEGFCVPLVESMVFGVPVLAYAVTAVPETLGGSGVAVTGKDLPRLAAVMERMLGDEALRANIIAGERARLAAFAPARTQQLLKDILERDL